MVRQAHHERIELPFALSKHDVFFKRHSFDAVVLGCAPRLRLGPLAALGTATSRSAGWATDIALQCRTRLILRSATSRMKLWQCTPRDRDRNMGPHGWQHKMTATPPDSVLEILTSISVILRSVSEILTSVSVILQECLGDTHEGLGHSHGGSRRLSRGS